MEKTPKLYYQCIEGVPFDNFCSDAAIGAQNSGIKPIPFEAVEQIPFNPYHIVVAPVEDTLRYLNKDIGVIDHSWASSFLRRNSETFDSIDLIEDYPCFIKPANQIKAFTGFVSDNKEFSKQCSYNYEGPVIRQEVVNIVSEYRVYMSDLQGILGVYWYSGDPFIRLDKHFVEAVCKESQNHLTQKSYTLDFGVMADGETFLIEVNDGWAIGNYGMPPTKYYHFVKNRFLQLTGVLK